MEIRTPLELVESPLQAVIWDVDGTMMDSLRAQHTWFKQAVKQWGNGISVERYGRAFIERYNKAYLGGLHSLYAEWGMDLHKYEAEIWAAYNEFYSTHIVPPAAVHGESIADVIREIHVRGAPTANRHTRLRQGINTTKGLKTIRPMIERAGIWDCFDTIVTYDDIVRYVGDSVWKNNGGVQISDVELLRKLVKQHLQEDLIRHLEKPNSLSSMFAVGRLGVPAQSIIAIEDTVPGTKAYKPVILLDKPRNIYTVAVTWGHEPNPQALWNAGADALVEKPSELLDLIEALGGFR